MTKCNLCPRRCGINRETKSGYCGVKSKILLAKTMLHKWEEPCISVKNGAGTIFFSGCSLHCCYCQNNLISNEAFGCEVSVSRLAEIFLELQANGADNIELITPTHYITQIIKALDMVKHKIVIPIIYNTSGYELTQSIEMLKDYIDVFIPDLKYYSSEASMRYSNAPDYFKFASEAVLKMIDISDRLKYNEYNALVKGTIIRHLVLPGLRHDSMKILEWIAENITPDQALVSIMCQYTPFDFIPDDYLEIKRRITKMEYNSVVKYAVELGIKGFTQQHDSSSEQFVPEFDLEGVIKTAL